jgi:hypothetical protein
MDLSPLVKVRLYDSKLHDDERRAGECYLHLDDLNSGKYSRLEIALWAEKGEFSRVPSLTLLLTTLQTFPPPVHS